MGSVVLTADAPDCDWCEHDEPAIVGIPLEPRTGEGTEVSLCVEHATLLAVDIAESVPTIEAFDHPFDHR